MLNERHQHPAPPPGLWQQPIILVNGNERRISLMGTDSDPTCSAAGPYRNPAASNSRTGFHVREHMKRVAHHAHPDVAAKPHFTVEPQQGTPRYIRQTAPRIFSEKDKKTFYREQCEYVIAKLNAASQDNSILQAQLEELKEIFREKVNHLEEEVAHLTYKNQQMNHAAKNLQTYMSKQPILFSDQLPDDQIVGKTFLLLKRIKDWSSLFSGTETGSHAELQEADLEQYRAVLPGTTDLESLHAQLCDEKRRRLFVRGWTAYIICNTVFPASRDGAPSVPKTQDSMPANEAYQERVLALESMMRSMKIPTAKVNDWRAFTFHLSPESDDMGNIESTWMQKACARVLTVIKPWGRPEDMLMAVEELLSIFQEAVDISAVLQRQRACWTIRFPGVPQTDAAYVLPFDSKSMMAKDAEGAQGSRTVEGVITPAVFKRGNADGEAFDVEACAQEAVVVTSEDSKEEVRHSRFIETDVSLHIA